MTPEEWARQMCPITRHLADTPCGPCERVAAAIHAAVEEAEARQDAEIERLREARSRCHRCKMDEALVCATCAHNQKIAAVEEEREACATVADHSGCNCVHGATTAQMIAARIRARKDAGE